MHGWTYGRMDARTDGWTRCMQHACTEVNRYIILYKHSETAYARVYLFQSE